MTLEHETPFEEGNITSVVRVGQTVRRKTGPWTPAVHTLLTYLEMIGFEPAPRVLGFDGQGREVLSYIEGNTGSPSLQGIDLDEVLIKVAQLIRLYHDSVAGFHLAPGAAWQIMVGAPDKGEVICHNDLSPWNTLFLGKDPVAFIDWDLAAPGPRIWDLAYALWSFIPLYGSEEFGTVHTRARRISTFCNAYRLKNQNGLLDTIERRMQVSFNTMAAWGAAGVQGWAGMWRNGYGDGILSDLAYFQSHRMEFQILLNG